MLQLHFEVVSIVRMGACLKDGNVFICRALLRLNFTQQFVHKAANLSRCNQFR